MKGGWKFKLRRGNPRMKALVECFHNIMHNAGQKPRKLAISKQLRRGGFN